MVIVQSLSNVVSNVTWFLNTGATIIIPLYKRNKKQTRFILFILGFGSFHLFCHIDSLVFGWTKFRIKLILRKRISWIYLTKSIIEWLRVAEKPAIIKIDAKLVLWII